MASGRSAWRATCTRGIGWKNTTNRMWYSRKRSTSSYDHLWPTIQTSTTTHKRLYVRSAEASICITGDIPWMPPPSTPDYSALNAVDGADHRWILLRRNHWEVSRLSTRGVYGLGVYLVSKIKKTGFRCSVSECLFSLRGTSLTRGTSHLSTPQWHNVECLVRR